jgi:Tol biopolymer transport system component
MNVDGTGRRKLVDGVGSLAMWSPDGTALMYLRMVALEDPKDPQIPYRTEYHLISTVDAQESLILANDTDYGLQPVGWSGDGRLFYYAAVTLGGEWELRGVEVPSGAQRLATRLSWDLASGISLSPDGTQLLFSAYQERQPVPLYVLVVLPTGGGQGRVILSGAEGDGPGDRYVALWYPDGQSLIAYIPLREGQPARIEQMGLGTGEGQVILAAEGADGQFLIPRSLSPDGQWLIMLRYPSMQTYMANTARVQAMTTLPSKPSRRVGFMGWAITGP